MKIVRLLKVKNERELVREGLEYYASLGIASIILDNGSTDGTYEICQAGLSNGSVIALDQLKTEGFDRKKILTRLDELCEDVNPDWALVADADEFIEPYQHGISLREVINTEGEKGNNLLQGANMEFWMTSQDDNTQENVRDRLRFYSFFPSQKFIAYQFVKGTSLVRYNNHAPDFPSDHVVKLSDELLIIRHYKFQNLAQARSKIREVVPSSDAPTVGFHYIKFDDDSSHFVVPVDQLTRYNENGNWNFDIKYFGNRMNQQELKEFLGIESAADLHDWFKSRNPFFRPINEVVK